MRAFRRYLMGTCLHNPPSRFLKDLPQRLIKGRGSVRHEAAEGRDRGPGLARLRTAPSDTPSAPRPAPPGEAVFAAGDHVLHGRFGEGVVVSCTVTSSDQEVTVAFKGGSGVKKLLLSYAPLEKV